MKPNTRARIVAVTLLSTLLVGGAAGCAGGGSDGDATSSDGGGIGAVEGPASEAERRESFDDSSDADLAATSRAENGAGVPAENEATEQPAVISTARLVLEADDVVKARDGVGDVVADHGGKIDFEETSGGEDARRSELVARVPADDFDDVLREIGEVAEITRSSRQAEDVTTQVIDNRARIRAQERSIRRVELLLDRATSIRDIITIERQLAERQAELDSLKQRRAYLADQTSMATITVRIERTDTGDPDDDDSGFLPGLRAGWAALVAFAVGVLTVLGAALPFAVLIALIGVPAWLLLRRRWATGLVTRVTRTPRPPDENQPPDTAGDPGQSSG